MEEKQTVRTRRVGTVTFGSILVIFGTLFLLHIFLPALNYGIIFRCWPCILILLGIEVLVENFRAVKQTEKGISVSFVYDKAAILLMICLTFFSMVLAAADFCMQYGNGHIQF